MVSSKIKKIINLRGSITIFVSIVLASIFLVAATFVDAARIKLAEAQIQRAGGTALTSVLGNYNNLLKDQYGLFAYYLDYETLNDTFGEYLSRNLNIGSQDLLYGYNIENVLLERPLSLGNREIFERQINDFMKYRAPAEIAADLISKINGIKNISKGSKLYKKKMETDKKAGAIGELQLLLEDKSGKINNSGITTKIKELSEKYSNTLTETSTLNGNLNKLEELYSKEKDKHKKDDLTNKISSIKDAITAQEAAKSNIKNALLESLKSFKNLNEEAMEFAQSITTQKEQLKKRIEEELAALEPTQDGLKEMEDAYRKSLIEMKKLIAEDNSESIGECIESNINRCEKILSDSNSQDTEFLRSMESFTDTSKVNYTFNKANPESTEDEDNRSKVLQELNKALNKKGELKAISSELLAKLPSRRSNYYEENSGWNTSDFSPDNGAEKELDYLSEKESGLTQLAKNIAEELFLNEYIMGVFKHDVPLLKGEEEAKGYNLRGQDKTERDGYFSYYEVEYIINGNKDEGINSLLTKAEILSIRVVSNIIHIYTDPSKMSRVTSLAAALSSWNAGLSLPLIQTALVFSWAMFESLYDQEQLSLGEKIALFKTKDLWKTDISGAVNSKKSGAKDDNPFFLSYQDYLRIFLLMTDKDKKIARIQDLIQLNVGMSYPGYTIQDSHVALKAKTTVSIKNMFLSIPFFSVKDGRKASRFYIEKNMLLGY